MGLDLSGDDAIAFKSAEGEGEHALGNALDGATQCVESHGSGVEQADDQDAPLVANAA